jgi:IS5 family transposase
MVGKLPKIRQRNLFRPMLKDFIDMQHPLALLAHAMDWQHVENERKLLLREAYNGRHPKRAKKTKKAKKRLKTIANHQLRELNRKMTEEQQARYRQKLALYDRAANQQKDDKDKVYSLHKPFTRCNAKGKLHKPYEFGNKVGLIVTGEFVQRKKKGKMVKKDRRVIVAVKGFLGNSYDGHTIAPLLDQMKENGFPLPRELVYDRGGKGATSINGVNILLPSPPKAHDSQHQKQLKRKKCRTRAAIAPIIGHLKTDFRMQQNYHRPKAACKSTLFWRQLHGI